MNTKVSLFIALMVAGLFPALSLYAWYAQPGGDTEKGTIDLAVHFLKNGPTYKFDGIPESIKVVEAFDIRPPAPEWLVVIEFECRQAGYGDRTGQMLAQVITPHTMTIIVEEGKVVKAVIDEKWDELNQREIEHNEIQPPEFGRDKAVDYILQTHEELEGLQVPSSWTVHDLTPDLVGASHLQYVCDGWTVNVSYPVVLKPIYTVEIEYTGEVCFHWRGTVDQSGNVAEMSYIK